MKREYFPFIDGLRAFCIVWVIAHHLNLFFDMKSLLGPLYSYLEGIMLTGFLGVDVFFVISGFLITGLLLRSDLEPPNIPRFYAHRFFKIIPSYAAVVLVTFVLFNGLVSYSEGYSGIINYLLMVQNYVEIYEPLGHLWSIAIEEHFYVFYPLLIYGVWWFSRKTPQRFAENLTVMIVLLICVGMWVRHAQFSQLMTIESPWPWQKTHMRFDALLAGSLIRCLWPYLPSDQKLRNIYSWSFLVLLVVLVLSLSSMRSYSIDAQEYTKAYLMAASVVLVCLLNDRSWISRILSFGFLRWIGKNSCGIYLWHYPILLFMIERLGIKN